MNKTFKIILSVMLVVAIIALVASLIQGHSIPILDPKGPIAGEQRELLIFASLLSLIIIIPVFVMLFAIARRYRESNKKAKYTPEWDKSGFAETIWWGIPIALILVLSTTIWISSHKLDPYKALESDKNPVRVQVIALQWKWLFVYPEQNIASVNYLQFPEDTPVNFEITSDAPMNSFWIPQLGGQVYAMSGMTTKLHLMADEIGSYKGSSANLSGDGFAGMKFEVKATSQRDFDAWVKKTKDNEPKLSQADYDKLSEPSKNNAPRTYSSQPENLYDTVVMKYMTPESSEDTMVHEGEY